MCCFTRDRTVTVASPERIPERQNRAIVRVQQGDAVFSPRLAGFVLDALAGDLPPGVSHDDPELDQLTAWAAGRDLH